MSDTFCIHADLKLKEIIERYPETEAVFTANGLEELVSVEAMRVLAPFLTLGTALRSRSIDIDGFISLLEAALEKPIPIDSPGLASMPAQKDLTFLGLMPCGLKMPERRAFTQFINNLQARKNVNIQWAVEGNVNQELSYYSYIDTIRSRDELPDIILSADSNVFLGRRFHEQFVAGGGLTGYSDFPAGPNFLNAGIPDPENEYTILCVNPLVIVANLDQLNNRKLPSTWADILDPSWEKSVIIRGGDGFFCHAVLLPTYKQFRADGLKALAGNVLAGIHPAQRVNRIDGNEPGALYVMPAFFADRIRHKERIRLIWPEDGALASQVILQVKPEKIQALKPVLDYLVDRELAETLAGAGFPVPRNDVSEPVQEKPLKWLGWDYLREHDLFALNREIDKIFLPLVP